MSLIITNKKTLKDIAIIPLKSTNENIKEEILGDLVLIKSNEEVVGLNVLNYSRYFQAIEGPHTITPKQKEAINKLGFNIKDISSKFIIGEIVKKNTHPKTNKLIVLKIQTSKELQIVTNDLTVKLGEKVVVANIGAILPAGLNIMTSKVMGIESEGMLCGGETLGKGPTKGVMRVAGNNGDEYIL